MVQVSTHFVHHLTEVKEQISQHYLQHIVTDEWDMRSEQSKYKRDLTGIAVNDMIMVK